MDCNLLKSFSPPTQTISACFLIAIAIIFSSNTLAGDGDISFKWALVASAGPEQDRKLFPITKDVVLTESDQLKMMLEFNNDCYIYVLYSDNNKVITRLFPATFNIYKNSQKNNRYYLPEGSFWFTLDDQVGVEKIHLIASDQRMVELETLLTAYDNLPPDKQAEGSAQILKYLKKTRKKNMRMATVAERPIEIGGSFRSGDSKQPKVLQDLSLMAVEITGSSFFARTYTIDHK